MQRFFIEVSYKGTAYSGFQKQPNTVTIQSEIERVLATIYRSDFELTGSSRTDAGVHALQNYFHFDTELQVLTEHIYNLNALLPKDICIKNIFPVSEHVHARFSAISREYRYYITTARNPFRSDTAWLYPYKIDVELLRAAASLVARKTDFTAFSKRNTQVKTFNCAIILSEWEYDRPDLIIYHVKANRFLRGMVRALVATMLQVGRGTRTLGDLDQLFSQQNTRQASFSAPATGLFLESVEYNADFGQARISV